MRSWQKFELDFGHDNNILEDGSSVSVVLSSIRGCNLPTD